MRVPLRVFVGRLFALLASLAVASLMVAESISLFLTGCVGLGVAVFLALIWFTKPTPPPHERGRLYAFYGMALVLWTLPSSALAQVDDPSTPNKNEAILHSDLPPATFVRTPELQDALERAAAQVRPLDANGQPSATGRILTENGGMSDARSYWAEQYGMLVNTTYKSVRNPRSKMLRQADAGSTANVWANCEHGVWSYSVLQATNDGGTKAVQWAFFYMTQGGPLTYGAMTAAQLDAIIGCQLRFFPNTRGVTFSTIQWTGQSLAENYAPAWSVHQDDALFASYAGIHFGIPVDYIQTYADGDRVNPANGLSWLTTDSVEDGIHPTTAGAQKMAAFYTNVMRNDPVYWFYWNDRTPPLAGPPPPPPTPTYGPLDGAQRKLLSGTCSVVWGALEAPLPNGWCEEL